MFGLLRTLTDPHIAQHLLREEGEVIVDEVHKHWAAYARPALEGFVGVVLLSTVPFIHPDFGFIPLLLGFGVLLHAAWLALGARMDRFVITNMRVFRVHGVFATTLATMPLSRILDITVARPFTGRILNYGHFVFESAAQEQGLRDIRFVGRPGERDLAIQRVVQRSGLRGPRVIN